MILKALAVKQHSLTFYTAPLPLKVLAEHGRVRTWSLGSDGYQRKASEKRSQDFGRFYREKGNYCVQPVHINIVGDLVYDEQRGTLMIADTEPFWIVDGQTRSEGWREDISLEPHLAFDQANAVFTNWRDPIQEAMGFLVPNGTQRQVPSGLIDRGVEIVRRVHPEILQRGIDNGSLSFLSNMDERQMALQIIDILNHAPESPLFSRIRLPNDDRAKRTTGSQESFTRSLVRLVSQRWLKEFDAELLPELTAKMLMRYWSAIREACPLSFEHAAEYLLLKGAGIRTVNLTLRRASSKVRDLGGQYPPSKRDFKGLVAQIPDVFSDTFWRSNSPSGAGRFGGGELGWSNLQDFVESRIDEITEL